MDRGKALTASFATGLVAIATLAWYSRHRARQRDRDTTSTDPGLLAKGTRFERYETPSGHVYPKIRTFYHEHPQAAKLPNDLPLLVFMHGLGGSSAQFNLLLTSLVNVAPCLAIDLPGCGRSDFEPKDDTAYTTTAFAELLFTAIDRFRNKDVNQKIILFGHSMGCSIAVLLASSNSPLAHLCSQHIVGMITICPRSTVPTEKHLHSMRLLQWIWSPLFDLVRTYDRIGGVDSVSVLRVAGPDADRETKKLQLRYNEQSSSAVFQKMLRGVYIQETEMRKTGQESLLGKRTWAGLKVPLFLVAAKGDKLAPPKEAEQIAEWLEPLRPSLGTEATTRQDSKTDVGDEQNIAPDEVPKEVLEPSVPATTGDVQLVQERLSRLEPPKPTNNSILGTPIEDEHTATKHAIVLKTSIFPEHTSHGLIYNQKDVRILCNLIEHFLGKHVDERLLPGWQLSHLTTSGKWDVKNLKKWQSIEQCSEPIGGIFRAMKTMREIDEVHNPRDFVKKYSYKNIPDGVAVIVDISHDVPVYNKEGLEEGGVEYHKFPTVSKQPPTPDEVENFNGLIDGLRRSPKVANADSDKPHPTIGVHCHYGFNRTGMFIVSYLVEKESWKLEDAIDEFAQKRKPGIKHEHFINELYARYAAKMERRNTVIG